MVMKHSLPLFLVLLMVIGCKPTVPSQYIQPDDMEDILYDYHMAKALAQDGLGDAGGMEYHIYIRSVLLKHEVTEAEFDSSLVYYYGHIDRLKSIYAHVNERLEEEAERVGASVGDISQYSQYGASGDTANVWTGPSDVLLIPRPTKNRFDFTVKADSSFLLGDSFMFQFKSECISPVNAPNTMAFICAEYEGDSIQQFHTYVSANGTTQLRVQANNSQKLKELRGFVYLGQDERGDVRTLMFISQMQFIRFHNKTIQENADETEQTVSSDSLSRVDNPRGEVADTASHPSGRGLRSKSAPFRRRTATH